MKTFFRWKYFKLYLYRLSCPVYCHDLRYTNTCWHKGVSKWFTLILSKEKYGQIVISTIYVFAYQVTGVWPVICRFQFRPHFHPLNLLFLPSYHSLVPRFKLKFNPSTLSSWLGHAFLKKMGGHFWHIWQKVSKCPLKCRFEISP